MTGPAVLDVRTYELARGRGAEFDRLARDRAVPMLERYGIRVVACGPSADDPDRYLLIRAFPSAQVRQERLAAFYGSDEWRREYEPAVAALLVTYHVVVLELSADTVAAFAALGTADRG